MNLARVKAAQKRTRYFSELFEGARADAIRDAEALLALLKGRGTLRRVHFAAYDVHMTTGLLYSHAAWLAQARKSAAAAQAGKRMRRRGSLSAALGWPEPSDVYNGRQKRERGEA